MISLLSNYSPTKYPTNYPTIVEHYPTMVVCLFFKGLRLSLHVRKRFSAGLAPHGASMEWLECQLIAIRTWIALGQCPTSLGWFSQRIGFRENLQEHPIFNGKIDGFGPKDVPLNRSTHSYSLASSKW